MTVPMDGPSPQVFVPASASHFTELNIPVPVLLFQFQDASPGPASSSYNLQYSPLGEILLSGTAFPEWQAHVGGWTRDGLHISSSLSQAVNRFSTINATGSFAFLAYIKVAMTSGTAVNRPMACFDGLSIGFSSDLSSIRFDRGTSVSTLTSSYNDDKVHAFLAVRNMASQTCSLYTELGRAHIGGTTTASGLIRFGGRPDGIPAESADIRVVWGTMWTGTASELDEAAAKTTLQHLSWSVEW